LVGVDGLKLSVSRIDLIIYAITGCGIAARNR